MRFALLLLASLASALPSLFTRQDACAGDKSVAGYCTPLTYNDVTSASSVSTADCQSTCRSILTDAGDWGVDFRGQPAGYVDGMYLSGCRFGVARETDADDAQFEFDVANQDIVDLIDESISRFAGSHGGRVSAEGTMQCEGHVVRWFVGY
ncbi:putative necrosis-inducing factor-domain-containing protein [Annulohypoxylon bovei var. microspora]|nr:putative necrosis-inducing factor-domain-containing protein [Annulohypoxylon bovei var. microspora]